MKLYTSRYQNPELKTGKYTVVGITRSEPKFPLGYVKAGNIIEIAPPGYLFNENDRSVFTPKYFKHLDRYGIQEIVRLLKPYTVYGKDVVVCCYEDVRIPDEWCHRLVFAEWFEARTGKKVVELIDPSLPKGSGHKPQAEQISLFDNL